MIGDAVLGVVLWLGPLVAASWYAAQATGIDPRLDQTLGAGILWIGGDLIGLPFILIVVNRLSREDSRKAAVVDAELDAAGPTPGCGGRTTRSSAERFRRRPACERKQSLAQQRQGGAAGPEHRRRVGVQDVGRAGWRRRRGSRWWA